MSDHPHPLWQLPLTGTRLIEASAGTGKTWTISGLYLRLLLEGGLAPREILAVTFTIAATAELKARIRGRLLDLRDALAGTRPSADLEHFAQAVPDRAVLRGRLHAGLAGLEEATITTIHGFCQRVLADHAFELGLPFGMEVLEDETVLLREATADLWRQEIAGADSEWMRFARARAADPTTLAGVLKLLRGLRHARFLLPPEPGGAPLAPGGAPPAPDGAPELTLTDAYQAARELWQRHRTHAGDALASTPSGRRHAERWAERIDGYFAAATAGLDLPATDSVDLFDTLTRAAGASRHAALHALGEAISRLAASARWTRGQLERRYAELLVRGAGQVDRALQERKLADARASYDDLIVRVRDGLQGPAGERLAAQLRLTWKAALIDEFQDTDRDQYAIFARAFAAGDRPLFLVGDPKQAIYSFRGADIAAYLEACGDSTRRYALLENRRSAAGLVAAMNHLLGSHPNPFMNPQIGFSRVAGGTNAALQSRSGTRAAPLQWRWLSGEGRMNKRDAEPLAVQWTEKEIARLLGEGARGALILVQPGRPPRPVSGSDIAVLTGTHRESELVRIALQRRGIGCTVQTLQSVLAGEEARDMAILMRAVARPADPRRMKAALATRLVGESASAIAALDADVLRWDACVAEFERYGALARAGGWLAAWQALLIERGVAPRHLGDADGPRRLTNLRHLAELIDTRIDRDGLSLEAAAERLLRKTLEAGNQERELRLESDEALVRVMTVYGAKGLEFPIVFCPFLWSARAPTRDAGDTDIPLYHDERGLVADLGSEDFAAHEACARAERMEESIRLAYVAMTRAQACCYVACGVFNRSEQAPLTWLLHGARCEGPAVSAMADLKARYSATMAPRLRAELLELAAGSGGTMEVSERDADGPPQDLAPREWPADAGPRHFARTLRPRTMASFSSMAALADPERPDHDEHLHDAFAAPPRPVSPEPPGSTETFPRGARAGSCLHALFERVAPSSLRGIASSDRAPGRLDDNPTLHALVVATLREHGIASGFAGAAFQLLCNTLLTRLSPAVPPLAHIGERQRLTELAFHARIPSGYLKGYIDLVFAHAGRFFIVDYKSNTLAGYEPAQLERVMTEELYELQYRLYSAALAEYLRRRLPRYRHEEHFGGVFYLFCRGMHPSTGFSRGVYFARPNEEALEQLSRLSPNVEVPA